MTYLLTATKGKQKDEYPGLGEASATYIKKKLEKQGFVVEIKEEKS